MSLKRRRRKKKLGLTLLAIVGVGTIAKLILEAATKPKPALPSSVDRA